MGRDVADTMLVAITWRNRDGGIATFDFKGGAMSSQPMSQDAARTAAEQAFGQEQALVELEGGAGWTTRPPAKWSGLKAALPFKRAQRPRA